MKRKLVVGLGNTLIAEDARAIDFVRSLGQRDEIDIVEGGTDLLRLADTLKNRDLIVLVDAVDDSDVEILVLEHGSPLLDDAQQHAHHLSAVQALDLIRFNDENVRAARCVWVLIGPEYARSAP